MFLGLRLAFMNVWGTFCIGETVTCDLCFVPAAYCGAIYANAKPF